MKLITIKNGNQTVSNVRIKPGGDIFSEAQNAGAGGLAFIRVREENEIDTVESINESKESLEKKKGININQIFQKH